MTKLVHLLARVLFAWSLAVGVCAAQTAAPASPSAEASKKLDGVRAALDEIERTLQRSDLTDPTLLDLRSRLEPLTDDAQATLDGLAPLVDEVKARLDQLGPKPGDKASPEAPAVSAERDDQQKQFDAIDATTKRARLLQVQIEQASDSIAQRRRGLFTRALFNRSYSVLSPDLWTNVARVFPNEARAVSTVTSDWISGLSTRLQGWRGPGFLSLTVLIGILFVMILRAERRVVFRDPAVLQPSERRKATAALWVTAITAAAPVAAAMAFFALMRAFDLSNARMEPLTNSIFDMVLRISLTIGVARGLLAPGLPAWRLVNWPEVTVARVARMASWAIFILSIFKIAEAWGEIIIASLSVSIALRGVGALAVAVALGFGLRSIATPPVEDEECLGPVVAPQRDWTVLMRALVWAAIVAIAIAALIGYIAFSAFLTEQMVWITFIGCALFLLNRFAQETILRGLRPESRIGRAVVANVGLRRESLDQIAILLSGATTLALIVAAAMLALAPWGVESNDMLSNFRAAFFGFKVGDVTISLASIIISIVVFGLVWGAARALQNWLEMRFLPHTQLDLGLRNSIRTSVGYIGFIFAVSLALGYLGLSFEKLALVAGALSVGIGFGLQSIVNNFVSGLILLWERAIRVGDWVVVGDEQGYVRRINVRSTEIETFDRATMIVPNSNLVSGVVKNWVRNDRVGRIKNSVAVNIAADPGKVRDALLACAREHELVLKAPAPQVLFISMTDNMLKFDLVSFVADVERAHRVKSDLNFAIFKSFGDAGLDMLTTPLAPPPTMTGLDRAEVLVARNEAKA